MDPNQQIPIASEPVTLLKILETRNPKTGLMDMTFESPIFTQEHDLTTVARFLIGLEMVKKKALDLVSKNNNF